MCTGGGSSAQSRSIGDPSREEWRAQVLRLRKLLERAAADSLRPVALWNAAFLPSYDLREAMTAFMAKRAPKLDGR